MNKDDLLNEIRMMFHAVDDYENERFNVKKQRKAMYTLRNELNFNMYDHIEIEKSYKKMREAIVDFKQAKLDLDNAENDLFESIK